MVILKTKPERTGGRDLWFSQRHRRNYGPDMAMTDVDGLWLHACGTRVVGMTEMKHCMNPYDAWSKWQCETLRNFANQTGLALFFVVYQKQPAMFRVWPGNDIAATHDDRPGVLMTEQAFRWLEREVRHFNDRGSPSGIVDDAWEPSVELLAYPAPPIVAPSARTAF